MKYAKTLGIAGAAVLVAALAAAFLVPPRRSVTTASPQAYREYLAGQEDLHRMYLSDAQRHFETALRKDPRFVMAMVSLAGIRMYADPPAVKGWLARANAEREHVTRRERLALDLMGAWSGNRMDQATRLAVVLKDDYHDERGYSFLYDRASSRGQGEHAAAICREWLAVNPNNAAAYNLLGYNAAYRGDYEEAVSDFKKYAFLAPDEANPFDSLGEVEAANGRYEDAIRDLKKALSIKPDFFPSLAHLGIAYSGKGDFVAAREALEAAERGYRDNPGQRLGVLIELMTLSHRERNLAREREAVERATALELGDLGDPRALMRAGLASDEGRYEDAVAQWTTFRPPAKADEKIRAQYARTAGLVRGRIEFQAGHVKDAIAWIEQNLSPPGREGSLQEQAIALRSRAMLARAKALTGDVSGAEALLAINRKFNPRNPETLAALAEIVGRGKAS
jgi:tetratricopeptide (TPR) repeat protein